MAFDTDTITFHKVDPASSLDISLDISTGILTVAVALDRETISSYTFDIYADDGQRGGKALPIVSVQVVVLDVNDHAPQFINEPYSYEIDEGVSNKHKVCYHHTIYRVAHKFCDIYFNPFIYSKFTQ